MTSNINQGALTHAALLDDLSTLTARLEQAKADRDHETAGVVKFDIDVALERLHSVASVEEFGGMGTAPT